MPEFRQFEQHGVDGSRAFRGALPSDEGCDDAEDDQQADEGVRDGRDDGVCHAVVGEVEDELRDSGQFHVLAGKGFLELRHDGEHQEDEDAHGDDQDDQRVDHGRDDFAAQFVRFFMVFGQSLEDDFEHTADFTGFDHVDEEFVEEFGVGRQRFGEGGAALHGVAQRGDGGAQVGVGLLLRQDVEALQQRQAGVDQGGQLAREDHEFFGADGSAGFAASGFLFFAFGVFFRFRFGGGRLGSFAGFDAFAQKQALCSHHLHGSDFAVSSDDACFLYAVLVKRSVFEIRHMTRVS